MFNLKEFRAEKDKFFARHPQSPLTHAQKHNFLGLKNHRFLDKSCQACSLNYWRRLSHPYSHRGFFKMEKPVTDTRFL